jgi:hypothetical protein
MIHLVTIVAQIVTRQELPIPQGPLKDTTIADVLHVVFGFAGAIALLVIARAAFRYTISQGESQKIAKEKDAIIYAIIGLIVAILGYNIVTFVIERVK